MKLKFDLDDILIQPEIVTTINSRSEVNPYYDFEGRKMLPLITAPMDTVINKDNVHHYIQNHIFTTTVRTADFVLDDDTISFQAMSLIQFKQVIKDKKKLKDKHYILIDIANGHMKSLQKAIIKAKKKYGKNMIIMAGNVAHPTTFKILAELGVDYVRIGIGNGNGCLTTVQTGIGYPMGSLIEECRAIKDQYGLDVDIVADGGIKSYSDIIKSLALGADLVMAGSIFNKALESAGTTFIQKSNEVSQIDQYHEISLRQFNNGKTLLKEYRGMSTKKSQKLMGNTTIKTSEGVERLRPVEYTLKGWSENFTDYLRSAMSYTNSRNLVDFIGNVDLIHITTNALERIKK